MSEILQRAKAHYRDRLAAPLQFVEVPEWPDEKGEATKIYYRSSMTLSEQQEILALNSAGKVGEALTATLIAKALDAEGKKVFKLVNRTEFMRSVDSEVIARIVSSMNADDGLTDEEIEKN
jgi:hypothetical protein